MARSGIEVHGAVAVVFWSLILIQHHHADWSAQGDAKLGAGLDLHLVLFISRCC